MSLNHYVVGNLVVLVARFAVVDPLTEVETAADPTTVTFTVSIDHGAAVTYALPDPEIANPAVGTWTCELLGDTVGRWRCRVAGTGACHAASEDSFDVDPSDV